MARHRKIAVLLALIAAVISTGCGGDVVRIPPPPAWKAPAPGVPEGNEQVWLQLQLPASPGPQDGDKGAAEAARQFATRLVSPDLARPESAVFPLEAVSITPLVLVGKSNGGRIDEWLVDGAVDSKNRYGLTVRSRWKMVLARSADSYFPIRAALEGVQIFRMRGDVEMLAEARQAEVEQREEQAGDQKAKELAANRAAWKALDEAKPDEEKADAALNLALSLLDAGRDEPAKRRLQEIIDKFPKTRAAARAEELLSKGASSAE